MRVSSIVVAVVVLCSLMAAPAAAATRTARSLLDDVAVARERGGSRYDRDAFGGWIDADGDGCDTREEVLIAESRDPVVRGSGCSIVAGRWFSPYDGATWRRPSDVDIDHVVALGEAWRSGAAGWSARQRRRFANDLRFGPSLAAVTDNVNAAKGDRDPAEWLPARARCRYAIRWTQIKYRWRLRIDAGEHRALARILDDTCGARRVTVPRRAIAR